MGLGVLNVRFWVSPMRRLTQLGCERTRSIGNVPSQAGSPRIVARGSQQGWGG